MRPNRSQRLLDVARAILACAVFAMPVQAAQKRALIVAVSKYADSGWTSLSASRDADILSESLKRHEFDAHLKVLRDPAATKANVLKEFRAQLITPAAAGDILVFIFAGHGQRLSDNDGDESDGYDEALVLYDTPRHMVANYKGQGHLRDDELNELFSEARRKIGPSGHLFVALDSCFSGGGGKSAIALARSDEALDAAAPDRTGHDTGSGFDLGSSEASMGTMALISAAQSNEEAREAKGPDGKYYGSLSLALSRTLDATRRQANYYAVHDAIARQMAGWVPNRPQLEGDREQLLFSGQSVMQKAYFTVVAEPNAGAVRVRGGGIHGILPDARIAFHPSGTASPAPESRVARGTVTGAESNSAVVKLTEQRNGVVYANTWAFVEEYSFGEIRTRVEVTAQAPDRALLLQMLSTFPLATVVSSGADVRFDRAADLPARLTAVETSTGTLRYADSIGDSSKRLERVRSFLRDYTRSTYLRKLDVETAGFDVNVKVVPCKIGPTRRCAGEIAHADTISPGGRFGIKIGDGFRLLIDSQASSDLFVSVLDVSPENTVSVLWPPAGMGAQKLKQGARNFEAGEFLLPAPAGQAMLKVIATKSPITFDSIVSDNWTESGKGPLDGLFADALSGKASTPVFPTTTLAIRSVVYDIVP